MLGKSTHLQVKYPAEKHPKCSKFVITDMRQKPVDFFAVRHERRL